MSILYQELKAFYKDILNKYKYPQQISSWRMFSHQVRLKNCCLLKSLDQYPNSILVSGCQRSGTTMLTKLISSHEEINQYFSGPDSELEAALILSGHKQLSPSGRYCFQTTYLNDCYKEYFLHDTGHTIIWSVRNPVSVVHSMIHNWRFFALNELFLSCGDKQLFKNNINNMLFSIINRDRLIKACASYIGKNNQIYDIISTIKNNRVLVVDYDILLKEKFKILPKLFEYLGLLYRPTLSTIIKKPSPNKKKIRFTSKEIDTIKELCDDTYRNVLQFVNF
jgi:hypothetical protein